MNFFSCNPSVSNRCKYSNKLEGYSQGLHIVNILINWMNAVKGTRDLQNDRIRHKCEHFLPFNMADVNLFDRTYKKILISEIIYRLRVI